MQEQCEALLAVLLKQHQDWQNPGEHYCDCFSEHEAALNEK
jgi:hypothetical protein